MTRPDQPAPGEDPAESDVEHAAPDAGGGEHTAPGAGGGQPGDADPRDPTKDAAGRSPVDPEPLEPPD